MEGGTDSEPKVGMVNESGFQIAAPSIAAKIFFLIPLVEFSVRVFNAVFLKITCAFAFDVA